MLTKEDFEKNLERIQDWIKAADQKVSIFLAFQGVVLTILFTDTFVWVSRNLENFSIIITVAIISSIILIGCSIYKTTSAVIPRLAKKTKKKALTYFADIAGLSLADFKKAIKDVDIHQFEDELIEQIHICSKISTRKHIQFRDAIILFISGLILLALSFLIFKIGYVK